MSERLITANDAENLASLYAEDERLAKKERELTNLISKYDEALDAVIEQRAESGAQIRHLLCSLGLSTRDDAARLDSLLRLLSVRQTVQSPPVDPSEAISE
jgi:hypothetical protein